MTKLQESQGGADKSISSVRWIHSKSQPEPSPDQLLTQETQAAPSNPQHLSPGMLEIPQTSSINPKNHSDSVRGASFPSPSVFHFTTSSRICLCSFLTQGLCCKFSSSHSLFICPNCYHRSWREAQTFTGWFDIQGRENQKFKLASTEREENELNQLRTSPSFGQIKSIPTSRGKKNGLSHFKRSKCL